MTLYQVIQAFNAADAAWTSALWAEFGLGAPLNRYLPEGRGADGSTLRAAYDQRELARRAYERAWNTHLCQ